MVNKSLLLAFTALAAAAPQPGRAGARLARRTPEVMDDSLTYNRPLEEDDDDWMKWMDEPTTTAFQELPATTAPAYHEEAPTTTANAELATYSKEPEVVQEAQIPDTYEEKKPEVQEAQVPETYEEKKPEVQEAQEPETYEEKKPEVQEAEIAPMTYEKEPEIKEAEIPDTYQTPDIKEAEIHQHIKQKPTFSI
jgi:hypothetical protein